MAAALAVSVVVLLAALNWGQAQPIETRLVAAATAMAVLAAWLGAAIARVAWLRFHTPSAIDAGGADDPTDAALQRGQAILQNTLEQAALAALVLIGLAVALDRSALAIAALAGLFSIGRTLFWAGYAGGAAARAFGFALTFYPSMLALLALLLTLSHRALS
ncbi:MAPEG family protein [Sphingomonas gilva]|uniref:MAPEG family protein n=1 Tax=Sphingomonas gilva TaxID=2305907 RepID=A0A396RMN9_9SPHN|nr:MAPEG family protein [Sphingomonas gilva]RHW17670.1 MAPEG family protein [Sphingomonas gilva]